MDAVILKYSVAKVSSEDDEYSTSELLSPGPSCKGWVTDKYCVYPQVTNFNQDHILKPLQIIANIYYCNISNTLFFASGQIRS